MAASFGTNFTVINDVQQLFRQDIVCGGPFLHLVTIKRGLKEYVAFLDQSSNQAYIEEVDITEPGVFKQITDDILWYDLYWFIQSKGYFDPSKERKVATSII